MLYKLCAWVDIIMQYRRAGFFRSAKLSFFPFSKLQKQKLNSRNYGNTWSRWARSFDVTKIKPTKVDFPTKNESFIPQKKPAIRYCITGNFGGVNFGKFDILIAIHQNKTCHFEPLYAHDARWHMATNSPN